MKKMNTILAIVNNAALNIEVHKKIGWKNSDAGIAEVRSGSFTLFFKNTYKVKIPVQCFVTV